jgi:hypothetical protein
MDARQIPARADVIGALDVLEHIVDDVEVMRQMFGALKLRGGVLVAVPQPPPIRSVFRYDRRGELNSHSCHRTPYWSHHVPASRRHLPRAGAYRGRQDRCGGSVETPPASGPRAPADYLRALASSLK